MSRRPLVTIDEARGVDWSKVFPHASKAFIDANAGLQGAELEPAPSRKDPAKADAGKEGSPKQRLLRYTLYRCELLDAENICTKFLTDALRYCGALSDDTIAHVDIRHRQVKVDHRSQ